MGTKMSVIFVCYSRAFVITVIVITEFDCNLNSTIVKVERLYFWVTFVQVSNIIVTNWS